jgi:hypothetical protein
LRKLGFHILGWKGTQSTLSGVKNYRIKFVFGFFSASSMTKYLKDRPLNGDGKLKYYFG